MTRSTSCLSLSNDHIVGMVKYLRQLLGARKSMGHNAILSVQQEVFIMLFCMRINLVINLCLTVLH